jgi:hypothetical protein
MADVLLYLLRLADVVGLDFAEATRCNASSPSTRGASRWTTTEAGRRLVSKAGLVAAATAFRRPVT